MPWFWFDLDVLQGCIDAADLSCGCPNVRPLRPMNVGHGRKVDGLNDSQPSAEQRDLSGCGAPPTGATRPSPVRREAPEIPREFRTGASPQRRPRMARSVSAREQREADAPPISWLSEIGDSNQW